jgi:hypothetical protein
LSFPAVKVAELEVPAPTNVFPAKLGVFPAIAAHGTCEEIELPLHNAHPSAFMVVWFAP